MIEEKKRKSSYLTILTIVTVICIIAGCVIHLGFLPFGGRSGKMKSEKVATDRFQNVSLELDVGDVKIEKGSEFSVTYKYPSGCLPEISVSGGKLTVKQKMKDHISLKDLDCHLTITVPEGEELKNVDGYLDAGSVEVSGFTFDKSSNFNMESDVGSIELIDCTFGDLKLEADVGNISLNACTFKNLTASGDVGDIDLRECSFDAAECTTDTGSINVYVSGDGNFSSLTCKTDIGSITVDTDDPIRDEKIDLKVSTGDITVNGKEYEGSYKN